MLVLVQLLVACSLLAGAERLNSLNASSALDLQLVDRGECGQEVAEPHSGQGLQQYFDGLRVHMGLLDHEMAGGGLGSPDKCTKKDIC
eukprot:3082296-Amphidinium_carterae.1